MSRRQMLSVAAGGIALSSGIGTASAQAEKKIEQLDPALDKIISTSEPIKELASGFGGPLGPAEGPLWWKEGGYLLFTDIHNNRRMKYTPGQGVTVDLEPTNRANGLTRDLQGRLLSSEHDSRRVTRRELDGSLTVLANSFQGRRLNRPNDVVVKSDGAIYFTDPWTNPAAPEQWDLTFAGVYRLTPDLGTYSLLIDNFILPNGLAFSPDESVLYVNDSRRGHIRAFDVMPNGMLAKQSDRVFADLRGSEPGVPDGMKVDVAGNVYCGGSGRLRRRARRAPAALRPSIQPEPSSGGSGNADALLRSRCVLDGRAYRAGRERREISAAEGRPRWRRAAHRGLSQDQPARARAGAAPRRRPALAREHRHPALSRQALRAVADRPAGGGQGALVDRLLRRERASRPCPCRTARALLRGPGCLPRHQGGRAQDLPRLSQGHRRPAGGARVVRRQILGARSLRLRVLHLGRAPRAAHGRAQELHRVQGPHDEASRRAARRGGREGQGLRWQARASGPPIAGPPARDSRRECELVHIRRSGCRLWFGHRRAIGDGGRSCHRPLGRFLPRLGPAGCHRRGHFHRRVAHTESRLWAAQFWSCRPRASGDPVSQRQGRVAR